MLYYQNLTTNECADRLKMHKLFIPIGTIEQHGPHLPLSVDVDIPTAIASKLAFFYAGIIAPCINYGARSMPHSGGGDSFPGTISVSGEILISYYREIFKSYIRVGAKQIIIINGHYENEPFIFEALEQCRETLKSDYQVIALSWWSIIKDTFIEQMFTDRFPGWHAEHAGLVETSLMLYLYPEKVKNIRLDHDTSPLAGIYIHPIDASVITNQGILASTSFASASIGEKLFIHICEHMKNLIATPLGMKRTNDFSEINLS